MKIVTIIFALLAVSGTAFADTSFKGEVIDSSGSGIGGAMIMIHWDSAGSTVGLTDNVGIRRDLLTKTDDSGRFAVELPPGFYDVFVSAMAFTPTCQKVRVRMTPTKIATFRLNFDPLVGKELGTEVQPSLPKR
jgi:hypothetical protein